MAIYHDFEKAKEQSNVRDSSSRRSIRWGICVLKLMLFIEEPPTRRVRPAPSRIVLEERNSALIDIDLREVGWVAILQSDVVVERDWDGLVAQSVPDRLQQRWNFRPVVATLRVTDAPA